MSADPGISCIDLLEQAREVFRLEAFSRNLRKEISKKDMENRPNFVTV